MAEKTTEVAQKEIATSTNEVLEGTDAPLDATSADPEQATVATDRQPETVAGTPAETAAPDNTPTQSATSAASDSAAPTEPDELQPFIDKAFETIQHEVESDALNKFLRAHIKTFREEWDVWPDSAKDAYVHMMTSQLVQRKAARTRIMNYEEFKLPVPSAQTTLLESLKQSQIKPKKCIPVLLMPPNLRPTYSLKK